MLKVRLMGTKEEIEWFKAQLQCMPQLNVMSVSDIYSNSGTSRFYRCYAEVEKKALDKAVSGNEGGCGTNER